AGHVDSGCIVARRLDTERVLGASLQRESCRPDDVATIAARTGTVVPVVHEGGDVPALTTMPSLKQPFDARGIVSARGDRDRTLLCVDRDEPVTVDLDSATI